MNAAAMVPMALVGLAAGYIGSTINPSPARTGFVTVGELGIAGLGVQLKSSSMVGVGLGAAVGGLIGLAVMSATGDARAGAQTLK